MANIDLSANNLSGELYLELLTDVIAERISIFIFLSLKGRNRKEYREIFRRGSVTSPSYLALPHFFTTNIY